MQFQSILVVAITALFAGQAIGADLTATDSGTFSIASNSDMPVNTYIYHSLRMQLPRQLPPQVWLKLQILRWSIGQLHCRQGQ